MNYPPPISQLLWSLEWSAIWLAVGSVVAVVAWIYSKVRGR